MWAKAPYNLGHMREPCRRSQGLPGRQAMPRLRGMRTVLGEWLETPTWEEMEGIRMALWMGKGLLYNARHFELDPKTREKPQSIFSRKGKWFPYSTSLWPPCGGWLGEAEPIYQNLTAMSRKGATGWASLLFHGMSLLLGWMTEGQTLLSDMDIW